MRHSLLAGGKRMRPVLALATAEALGEAARAAPARRRGDRAGAHLLAHPRRPAGHGRRRPAPRPAHLPQAVRRGHGHPRRRRALRRGGAPGRRAPAGRTPPCRSAILLEISRATGVGGMVGGQYLDLKDAGRESAAALRRVHALKTGRLMSCAVHCALVLARPERRGRRGPAPLRPRARPAVPDRRRHPRRRGLRGGPGQGRRRGRPDGQDHLRQRSRAGGRAGAGERGPRPRPGGPGRGARAHRGPRGHHRPHLRPHALDPRLRAGLGARGLE